VIRPRAATLGSSIQLGQAQHNIRNRPQAAIQMASSPDSPVRMRMASSMLETKILPSPMRPVWAARLIAAIEVGMAFLPPETLGLGDGDALQSDFLKRLFHLVELERLDDGFYFFH
jgi:hypothetical protein